jgi:PHS family inorganic phosphate transporter-like MFS transporter
LSDRLGRKRVYGVEILMLAAGAVLSALSPSFTWLVVSRIIVGMGIGGDYTTSAIVTSEYSNRKNRGFLVLSVFSMQALGLIIGPLIAAFFLYINIPHELTWRILLVLGAVPASFLFHMRRKIAETPRFKFMIHAEHDSSSRHEFNPVYIPDNYFHVFQKQTIFSRKWLRALTGTAGAWFFLDIAYYGNGISLVLILHSLNHYGTLIEDTLLSAVLFTVFAIPGYLLSTFYVDRIGRKRLQSTGFAIMAFCYALVAVAPDITKNVDIILLVFGLSFFFINFGPNATTFLIPSEIFPTNIRARSHGISVAIGKIGAFIGALLFPVILDKYGLSVTMSCVAVISLCGVAITKLIPEFRQVSLESSEILLLSK